MGTNCHNTSKGPATSLGTPFDAGYPLRCPSNVVDPLMNSAPFSPFLHMLLGCEQL